MPTISNLACVTGWGKNNIAVNYTHQPQPRMCLSTIWRRYANDNSC